MLEQLVGIGELLAAVRALDPTLAVFDPWSLDFRIDPGEELAVLLRNVPEDSMVESKVLNQFKLGFAVLLTYQAAAFGLTVPFNYFFGVVLEGGMDKQLMSFPECPIAKWTLNR